MNTVLSPVEALGLSGAALKGRIQRANQHVSDQTLRRTADRLRDDAIANDMVYERNGIRETVRIMLRPMLAYREQLTYVHHVCLRLTEALKTFPALYLQDEQIRRILRITDEEERWLQSIWTPGHGRDNPVYGRLDAVCDFPDAGWQDTLKFMEPNLSGVGGIHFAPIAEQLVMRDVVPTLLAHDPELAIALPQDQRDLFVQVLIDHARVVGRTAAQICFVEPKYVHEGPDEQSALSRYLAERFGLIISHADPRELRVEGEEVYYRDVRVDIAYRDYETRDLIDLEKEQGQPLTAMRLLFQQNRVVSSISGDFDHKSCFEILTDPVIANRLFSADDVRLFERHVLWTRIVGDRKTNLPRGSEGHLLDYVRKNRETLVIKPNRSYGGTGVVIGALTEQAEWERLIDEAASCALDPNRSWVVQVATRLPVCEFPVVGPDGRVHDEPFYTVLGFAPTTDGLGVLCRVSQKQVVNVAQHGGLAVLLVADAPKELRISKRPLKRGATVLHSLRAQISELRHLDQTIALLEWDEETLLPCLGRYQRGEQIATLEGIRHNLLTSDLLGDVIEEAAFHGANDIDLLCEIGHLRDKMRRAIAVPDDLVRALAKAKSETLGTWSEARAADDYDVFAPAFTRLLSLVQERGQALAHGESIYDALLDDYEPGMTRSCVEPLLTETRDRLVPIVREAAETTRDAKAFFAGRRFDKSDQWQLSRRILIAIGFDFDRGRLDASEHPFTMLAGFSDVRLTNRVREDDIVGSILATLHEGGHGLYDQGFAQADRDRLLGEAPSMGLHESQARFWENHIGRDRDFSEILFANLRELSPDAVDGLDADKFWRGMNVVQPGVNRVGADAMSYHLHIVLRFELEVALLSGALTARELRPAWYDRSAALLGIAPASDREGVLQDVHWAVGMFGYFPTYTIGSVYAAQLAAAYERARNLRDEIRKGDFSGVLGWLRSNIHVKGCRFKAEEIINQATGLGLDTAAFFAHIQNPNRAWNVR